MKLVRLSALGNGPRKYSWYSFLLKAESAPWPQGGRKYYVNENSHDTIGKLTRDLPDGGAVPHNQLLHRVPRSAASTIIN